MDDMLKLIVEIVLGVPVGIVLLYIGVRVASAAWFQTKKQFNSNAARIKGKEW